MLEKLYGTLHRFYGRRSRQAAEDTEPQGHRPRSRQARERRREGAWEAFEEQIEDEQSEQDPPPTKAERK